MNIKYLAAIIIVIMVIAAIIVKTKFGLQGTAGQSEDRKQSRESMRDSDEPAQSAESIQEGENYTEDSVVQIENKSLKPQTIKGQPGKKVIWKNISSTTHTVVFDKGAYFTPPIKPEESAEIVFDKTGSFSYHSKEVPSIKGSVVISKPAK